MMRVLDPVLNLTRRLNKPLLISALLISFVFQLVVTISVPTIKGADFLRLTLPIAGQTIIFGIWSICTTQPPITYPGAPQFDQPAQSNCARSELGWNDSMTSSIVRVVWGRTTLQKGLALHPLSCALMGTSLLLAVVDVLRRRSRQNSGSYGGAYSSRGGGVLLPMLVGLSALCTLLAYIIDLALFVPAHGRIISGVDATAASTGVASGATAAAAGLGASVTGVGYGAGFWMSLVSTIAAALAVALLVQSRSSLLRSRRAGGASSRWSFDAAAPPTSSDRKMPSSSSSANHSSYAASDKLPLRSIASGFSSHKHSRSGGAPAADEDALEKGQSTGVATPVKKSATPRKERDGGDEADEKATTASHGARGDDDDEEERLRRQRSLSRASSSLSRPSTRGTAGLGEAAAAASTAAPSMLVAATTPSRLSTAAPGAPAVIDYGRRGRRKTVQRYEEELEEQRERDGDDDEAAEATARRRAAGGAGGGEERALADDVD